MASTSLSILTPTITGAAITAKTGVASSETITIQATTAQGAIDFATLAVRISAVGGSVTPTLSVGTEYSNIGVGSKAMTLIASSASVILGGHDFEGARFLSSADTLVITMAGTGTASIEAFQAPRATE
jgi:hypothetical protein